MRTLLCLACLLSLAGGKEMKKAPHLTLTVLYDNYNYDQSYKSSWGFACLIEGTGKTILFDTGGRDGNLMHNLEAAGKDPADIDLVVLSHVHWDHTGGLPEFLEARHDVEVFYPASFPDEYRENIAKAGARPVEVRGFREITEFVWTTGEMGEQIIEQSLLIESAGGLIVLTGCAHPGIEEIVRVAAEKSEEEILLVMGGVHLLRTGADAVQSIADEFRDMNIRYAAPTHCSGDETLKIFRQTYGDRFIEAGAGRVIKTEEL